MNLGIILTKQLGANWHNAAENDYDTRDRIKLYEDTEKVISLLSDAKNTNPEQIEEINSLCNALIQGFELADEDKSQKLSQWIAKNTSFSKGNKFKGAYPILNRLFEEMGKVQGKPVDSNGIMTNSLNSINSQIGPFEYEKVIGCIIYSHASTRELLLMCKTSHKDRTIAMSILIDRLNSKEITPSDLRIPTVTGLIDFFGNRCCEIFTLDLREFPDVNDQDIKNISLNFLNIQNLHLKNSKLTDNSLEFFSKMTQTITLDLHFKCGLFTNFNSLEQLKKLKNFTLSGGHRVVDFSFLKKLPELVKLDLSNSSFNNTNSLKGLKVQELSLSDCWQITDFSFLENMGGLVKLDLSICYIEDITSLQNLQTLEELDLSLCTKIKDMSLLQKLSKLKSLTLVGCKVTDFSFLQGMKGLIKLNLRSSQFTQIDLLASLEHLEKLDLSLCDEERDLSPLKSLSIKTLNLSNCNKLTDLSFLQEMKELMSLNLAGCQISDMQSLNSLKGLKELDLSACKKLKNLSFLQNIKGLISLKLAGCSQITFIDKLRGLQELRQLDLSGCSSIYQITDLKSLKKLSSLDLSGCSQINETNIGLLSQLKKLTTLSLSRCEKVKSLNPLQELKGIKKLDLSQSGIKDIKALQNWKELEDLNLSSCDKITDFSCLNSLKRLIKVDISWCTQLNVHGQRINNNFNFIKDLMPLI